MLDFSRQFSEIRQEVLSAIENVCISQKFILGPEVASFEQAAAKACAAPHAIGCASGTDALWLAMAAAGIGPGARGSQPDAAITTPFSFFATVSSILRCGARPLLVDIDPATFNLSPAAAETLLSHPGNHNIRAILPVHLYGQCSDFDALNALKHRFNLLLIEDAAQAFGAAWNGTPAGALGDAAAFSFYPTKNLSAFGDAGLVTTLSADIDERARMLRAHGMRRRYYHDEIGGNSRLDTLQAAVLEVKLRHLPRWNQQRRDIAARYDQLFRAAGLAPNPGDPFSPAAPNPGNQFFSASPNPGNPPFPVSPERVGCSPLPVLAGGAETAPHPSAPVPKTSSIKEGIVLPITDPRAHHVFHQYVIRVPRRDALRQYLTDHQIGSEIYYPLPLHLQTSLAHLGYKPGDFPHSEQAAAEVLALPMYPELREDEQQTVVEAITRFYA